MTFKLRQGSHKCWLFALFERNIYRILTVMLFLIIVAHASMDLDFSHILQPVILPLFDWISHMYINMEMDVVHMLLKRQDPDKN